MFDERGTRLGRTWRTLIGVEADAPSPPPAQPPSDGGSPFLDWVPPGHFYSIVPGEDDVRRAKAKGIDALPTLPGIRLAPGDLVDGFRERAALVREWDGGADRTRRYHLDNQAFDIADAVDAARHPAAQPSGSGGGGRVGMELGLHPRHHRRRRASTPRSTFIEPYPQNLEARLQPGDRERVDIRVAEVQTVPAEVFAALEAGDILFIDSSHVFKPGSDVDDYFCRVLPSLQSGVHVHIHDIFWPFEVPGEWLDEGRAWNEGHALRNFLYANDAWDITVFNDYFHRFHRDVIEDALPLMLEHPGGSIWLRRR